MTIVFQVSKEAIKSAPDLVREASKSPLGVFALIVLALSILAYIFFRKSPVKIRVGIFALMFIGATAFGIAVMRLNGDSLQISSSIGPVSNSSQSSSEKTVSQTSTESSEKKPNNSAAADKSEKPNDSDAGKKPSATASVFSVDSNYVASGKMGDVDDIEIGTGEGGATQFVYTPKGLGQHEWTWKYKDNQENKDPAKFGGVVYLSPPDDFGMSPDCGWDLRGFHRVVWEARSPGQNINVEFIIGGVNWLWHQEKGKWEKVPPPHPDSMPRIGLGTKPLSNDWQKFEAEIQQPPESFKRIVGGFSWIITW